MLVDSGATHNFVDPLLTPWLQEFVTDYSVLSVPHTIVTPGHHLLQGVATGTVRGTISDDGGLERVVSFRAVVVPGMCANLFSVTEAMRKGIATIFLPEKPRLEVDDIVLPMNLLGADERTGKLLCSIIVELGGVTGGFSFELSLLVCGTGAWDT